MTKTESSGLLMLLAQNSLFRGLPGKHLEGLAAACSLRTYRKKSYLFHEGESGRIAYQLVRGQIQLNRRTEDGREIVIRSVRAGEVFAEVILFESDRYPVSAVALTEVRCILIDRSGFQRMMDDVEFRNRFIGLLMERQRYLAARVLYLTSFDLEERFFRYLADHFGPGPVIEPGISRKDIAAAIGATPESLSRLISRLAADGRISCKGHTLTLLRPSGFDSASLRGTDP